MIQAVDSMVAVMARPVSSTLKQKIFKSFVYKWLIKYEMSYNEIGVVKVKSTLVNLRKLSMAVTRRSIRRILIECLSRARPQPRQQGTEPPDSRRQAA